MGALFKLLNIQGLVGLAVGSVLAALLALQTHKTHVEHRSAVKWELSYQREHSAFQQTVINYSNAAAQARAEDAANKVRVEREAKAVADQREASYEARIADARARARGVQPHPEAAADPRGPRTAPVSAVPAAPGGPDGAAGQDGLPPGGDALVATEQAIRLDELQKWVRSVVGIDLTGQ